MNEDGFFVVLKMRKIKTVPLWTANAVNPVKGWRKTHGETMQEALEGQRVQYETQLAMQKQVPDLVDCRELPMPTGQTLRFLSVRTGQPAFSFSPTLVSPAPYLRE